MKKNIKFISYLFLFIVSIAFAGKVSAAACNQRSDIIWSHLGYGCVALSDQALNGSNGTIYFNGEKVQSVEPLNTSDYLGQYILWQTVQYAEANGYIFNRTNLVNLQNAVNDVLDTNYNYSNVDQVKELFLPRVAWAANNSEFESGDYEGKTPVMNLLLNRIGVNRATIDASITSEYEEEYINNLKAQLNTYTTATDVVQILVDYYFIYYNKPGSDNHFEYVNYDISLSELTATKRGNTEIALIHGVSGNFEGPDDNKYNTPEKYQQCPLGLYNSTELITPIEITYIPTTCSDGTLIIRGVDEDGNIVSGKKFRVTGPDDYKKEFTIGEDRNSITISGLTDGEYTITEISVPNGYKLNTEIKKVTLSGETKTVEFVNEKSLIVTVPNTAANKLFLIGIAIIVMGLGIFILYRTVKKVKEDI